jgi:hypothetical protein
MSIAGTGPATRWRLASAALFALAGALPAPAQEASGLPLSGEAAETFLKTAEVVRKKGLSLGITNSDQYTLSDGTRTCKAVWKTIDEFKRGVSSLEGGGVIVDFSDSWKHEVAAYELDKLIGLGLVPPTVERSFGRTTGSLQMWVEGAMDESQRKQKKVAPPDPRAWNEQMYKVRLLHQLSYNTDYRNIRNVLIDKTFRVYAIDSSRAFAVYDDLRSENELLRFSRTVLEGLKTLDRPTLDARLGRWLNGPQIQTLLKRRDKILALAERRVQEQGEAAVLY